ncbi:MAG: urea ABC transporter permease subunit UrtB [Pseudomonadota bacterium]
MMLSLLRALLVLLVVFVPACLHAQTADAPVQQVLQTHADVIKKSSRKTIGPAIDALADSGLPAAQGVLERWQAKDMWYNKETGLFVFAAKVDGGLQIYDVSDGSEIAVEDRKAYKQLKPNSGIRGLIASALVRFQLNDPDPQNRAAALTAIERNADSTHLAAMRDALAGEDDPNLKARKHRLERLLTIRFDEDQAARLTAIDSFAGDLGVDLRATLNPLVASDIQVSDAVPDDGVAVQVGSQDLSPDQAYRLLVDKGLAPAPIDAATVRQTLVANLNGDMVAGVQVASLNEDSARQAAYQMLAQQGLAQPFVTETDMATAVGAHSFFKIYTSAPLPVALAAQAALDNIETQVALNRTADLVLDALSLASIYFLAAIGLAITFGVMGVINMAHGEFIMMGAYTGYVVQLFIPDLTLSILVAIPCAFLVTFGAGVMLERLVIRWLYHRPLETLLATFGVSIALQQLAKNIFGTQARPLTAPAWLDGSLVINDIVSISYIRIAIFVLALLFLALFLIVMNRTRLGLEVRAVTQNPRMAASMGINPDRINMLTFGFGSGIAGIAGVAIGLYAKVTSEMGSDYIVQSFMTVVVGGVGNIWGTLLGATLVGTLQKGIEWLNPSNTLAAQTYMILFIILFIQFRPRGIIALKGRAAEA